MLSSACARPSPSVAPNRALGWEEVLRLYGARNYFTMRDRLASGDTAGSLPARYARALMEHAFNSPARSNRTIASLLADPRLPRSLAVALRKVEVANDLRLYAYAAGLAAAESLLRDTIQLGTADLRDLRNTRELFRALASVPPQSVTQRGTAILQLKAGRAPVQINDSSRYYVFDTGANLSTIMRSEAVALGLAFHPSSIDVGTSTDKRVAADLAVADRLVLGGTELRHVVFLVLDDSLLTFPGGFHIPGIIGFPVISQLSEVQFSRDRIVIPADPPVLSTGNLALDELTPLTRVGWSGLGEHAELLCRLDTGADWTELYEPFYRRFRAAIDASTPRRTLRSGGAGGIRELPTRMLPRTQFTVGDTVVNLDSTNVLTVSITRDTSANFLDCNIGHDVLDQFPHTIINFRDMAFLLR